HDPAAALAEGLHQRLAEDAAGGDLQGARVQVVRAAGGERVDELDRLRRKRLCGGKPGLQQKYQPKKKANHFGARPSSCASARNARSSSRTWRSNSCAPA